MRSFIQSVSLIVVLDFKYTKKILFRCSDFAQDNFLLTQVSSGPEIIFLCSDYSNMLKKNLKKNLIIRDKENLIILFLNFFVLVFVFSK